MLMYILVFNKCDLFPFKNSLFRIRIRFMRIRILELEFIVQNINNGILIFLLLYLLILNDDKYLFIYLNLKQKKLFSRFLVNLRIFYGNFIIIFVDFQRKEVFRQNTTNNNFDFIDLIGCFTAVSIILS